MRMFRTSRPFQNLAHARCLLGTLLGCSAAATPAMPLARVLSFGRRPLAQFKAQPRTPSPSASSRSDENEFGDAPSSPSDALQASMPLSAMFYKKHRFSIGWDKRFLQVDDELGLILFFKTALDKARRRSAPLSCPSPNLASPPPPRPPPLSSLQTAAPLRHPHGPHPAAPRLHALVAGAVHALQGLPTLRA